MELKEVLKFMGLKKLPEKGKATKKPCIAKVSRVFGDDDYVIANNQGIIKDKGFLFCVSKILSYHPYIEIKTEPKNTNTLSDAEKLKIAQTEAKKLEDEYNLSEAAKQAETAKEEPPKDIITETLDIIKSQEGTCAGNPNEPKIEVRPTVYKEMCSFINEKRLTDEKTVGMSGIRANEILDEYFAK